MGKKRAWVVRVVLYDDQAQNAQLSRLIECLRYAGLASAHSERTFDLHAPSGVESRVWSVANAERMTSMGFNAVSAPEWIVSSGEVKP